MNKIKRLSFVIVMLMFFGSATQIPIEITGNLPASVDNSKLSCFPPIVNQGQREACGNATGIGYIFNYEISASRNASSKDKSNQYPFFTTFDFLNNGIESAEETLHVYYRHFLPAWKITQENGIPNAVDFGTSDLNSTRWLSGYDKYYRAMQNRVDKVDSISMTDSTSLTKAKQWLYNHGNGSSNGGILLFTANIYCIGETSIPTGALAGQTFIKGWGWSDNPNDPYSCRISYHTMAIVGYDDSVKFDFNKDGEYTNNIDINGDGKITPADREIGAFKIANAWGTSCWDGGLAYTGYRLVFIPPSQGGIQSNNRLYFITVKKNYTPKLALKVSITDAVRNKIALSVGVSSDISSTKPEKIRKFQRQFTYSGGAIPMCGKNASPSIEIGLDITDLLDSIPNASKPNFFIIVDSKGGTGTVDSLSLMDYRSGTLEQTNSSQTNISIISGTSTSPAKTYVSVDGNHTSVLQNKHSYICKDLTVRKLNGRFEIQLPTMEKSIISFSNTQGKRIATLTSINKEWIEIPHTFSCGIYVINIKTNSGLSFVKKISF